MFKKDRYESEKHAASLPHNEHNAPKNESISKMARNTFPVAKTAIITPTKNHDFL